MQLSLIMSDECFGVEMEFSNFSPQKISPVNLKGVHVLCKTMCKALLIQVKFFSFTPRSKCLHT